MGAYLAVATPHPPPPPLHFTSLVYLLIKTTYMHWQVHQYISGWVGTHVCQKCPATMHFTMPLMLAHNGCQHYISLSLSDSTEAEVCSTCFCYMYQQKSLDCA